MENDILIIRKVYAQVPPNVEYSLTENKDSLIPRSNALCNWGSEHMVDDIGFTCKE
jgi:DNA-binding HxlR family transcriptional regulator